MTQQLLALLLPPVAAAGFRTVAYIVQPLTATQQMQPAHAAGQPYALYITPSDLLSGVSARTCVTALPAAFAGRVC